MAMSADEVEDLFQLAAERNLFLTEGMWMKFNPAFIRLHDEIAAGRIGEPRGLRAVFGMSFPKDNGSRWDANRSGSTLLDQGVYPVTLAHMVFGAPAGSWQNTIHAPEALD